MATMKGRGEEVREKKKGTGKERKKLKEEKEKEKWKERKEKRKGKEKKERKEEKEREYNKCWQVCGRTGTLVHCSECKNGVVAMETAWQFLKKLKYNYYIIQ